MASLYQNWILTIIIYDKDLFNFFKHTYNAIKH